MASQLTKAQQVAFAMGYNAYVETHNSGAPSSAKTIGRGVIGLGFEAARSVILKRQLAGEDVMATMATISPSESQAIFES